MPTPRRRRLVGLLTLWTVSRVSSRRSTMVTGTLSCRSFNPSNHSVPQDSGWPVRAGTYSTSMTLYQHRCCLKWPFTLFLCLHYPRISEVNGTNPLLRIRQKSRYGDYESVHWFNCITVLYSFRPKNTLQNSFSQFQGYLLYEIPYPHFLSSFFPNHYKHAFCIQCRAYSRAIKYEMDVGRKRQSHHLWIG